jgi:hypothetical protein
MDESIEQQDGYQRDEDVRWSSVSNPRRVRI